MPTATAIQDAFVPLALTDPDGGRWLQVVAESDIYSHFKRLPSVVRCDGILYQKMSHNSDSFLIWYKEVAESQVAFKA